MSDHDFVTASISDLGPLIHERKLSPVEITRWHLDRISKLNGSLNAFLTVLADEAIIQAGTAQNEIAHGHYRGALHGIPIALKDIIAVKGVRMTCGSRILGDHLSTRDATVVGRLREAGAVLLGTLHLHEFAWGATSINPHFGNARNPWNPDRIPGGSSGGSAAAVAASMAMATLGTDTGGSVRIPSSLCGTTGLKPTYGRVSRYGAMALSWTMDKAGPMCRSVEDCAIVFNAIYGSDGRDETVVDAPFAWNAHVPLSSLKIGYVESEFNPSTGSGQALRERRGGGGRGGGLGGRGLGGGGGSPFNFGNETSHRYNLTLSVSARNLLNNVNYAPPIGNLNSPIFGTSNALAGPPFSSGSANRRIDLQMLFSF